MIRQGKGFYRSGQIPEEIPVLLLDDKEVFIDRNKKGGFRAFFFEKIGAENHIKFQLLTL